MKNLIKKILKESEIDWIKDVSGDVPPMNDRVKIPLTSLVYDYMLYEVDLLDYLHSEDLYNPTDEYQSRFTPEEWDHHGLDQWRDGGWKENGQWESYNLLYHSDVLDFISNDCPKWEFIESETTDWDLDSQTFTNRLIWKRKSDGRYFGLSYWGNSYDGIEDNDNELVELFQKQIVVFV